jgi:hypothetical protein
LQCFGLILSVEAVPSSDSLVFTSIRWARDSNLFHQLNRRAGVVSVGLCAFVFGQLFSTLGTSSRHRVAFVGDFCDDLLVNVFKNES